MTRRALYVGRFQPFHAGHLDVTRHALAAPDVDELVVAIGSAQYDHTRKSPVGTWLANPFTIDERLEMVRGALAAAALPRPWSCHAVPDYHDWQRWYEHLVERLPACQVLYTSDGEEARFFGARGWTVRPFPRRFAFHAGTVRAAMAGGDPYRDALPPAVLAVLDRIGAEARLAALAARDRGASGGAA